LSRLPRGNASFIRCSPKVTTTRISPNRLDLSLDTVETHRGRIMEKMNMILPIQLDPVQNLSYSMPIGYDLSLGKLGLRGHI